MTKAQKGISSSRTAGERHKQISLDFPGARALITSEMKSGFLFALTVLLAFVAGLAVASLLRPDGSAEKCETFLAASSDGSEPGRPDASQRPLPFANDGRIPQTTAELISDFRQAAHEHDLFRRLGRLWWLSQRLTPKNAKKVAQATLESSDDNDMVDNFVIGGFFAGWAHVDPLAALDYAQTLPKNQRHEAIDGALMGWAGDDPDAASAWVEKLPPGELKRSAQKAIIDTLAESNPDRALQMVMERSDDRFSFAFSIFSSLTKRNPNAAAEHAASLPEGRFRNIALRVVADNWSQQDREAALKWVDELSEGPAKQQTVSGVMQNWVRTDFDGALAWLQKRPEGSSRNRLIQALTYSVTGDNPENAIKLVDLIGSSAGQDEMLQDIARIWSRNDPAAAQQWAQSQTDSPVKKAVWQGVLSGMSEESPQQAATLALQLPPEEQNDLIGTIARKWANQDPAAAAKWTAALAGDTRTQALGNVMSSWVEDAPAAALKWFSTTPGGKERDAIVGRFVSNLAENDPNLAIQWAESIGDKKHRLRQLENLARNWMRNDSSSARTWITTSDLPPETKKRLLDTQK